MNEISISDRLSVSEISSTGDQLREGCDLEGMTRQRRQVEAMFSFLAGGIDCWPKQYLLHPDLELIRFEIDHALYSQAVTRAERYYTRHYRPKHPSEPASLQTLLISRMLTCVQGLSSYPEFFG